MNLRLSLENRLFYILTGLALLGGVCYFDFLTGYEIELNLLYSMPVLLVAWFTCWRPSSSDDSCLYQE